MNRCFEQIGKWFNKSLKRKSLVLFWKKSVLLNKEVDWIIECLIHKNSSWITYKFCQLLVSFPEWISVLNKWVTDSMTPE